MTDLTDDDLRDLRAHLGPQTSLDARLAVRAVNELLDVRARRTAAWLVEADGQRRVTLDAEAAATAREDGCVVSDLVRVAEGANTVTDESEHPCQYPGCTTPMTKSSLTDLSVVGRRPDDLPVIRGTSSGHVHMHQVTVIPHGARDHLGREVTVDPPTGEDDAVVERVRALHVPEMMDGLLYEDHDDCDLCEGVGHEQECCRECTNWTDEATVFVLWPCRTVKALGAAARATQDGNQ